MKFSRFLAGMLTTLLSVTLFSMTTAHARVPAGDPLATTVTGACASGPGRLSVTVHPPVAGKFQVEVTARGLMDGSRWAVAVSQAGDYSGSRAKDFRRVAVDGTWTVMTQFPAPTNSELDEVFFNGSARERGDRGHRCSVLAVRSPAIGASVCDSYRTGVAMFARDRDDGSTVIRSLIIDERRDTRWHLTLTATGAASRQMVEFDDRVRGGRAVSRVVFTGVSDPRLRLVASNKDRGQCFLRLDPANVTTDAPLKMPGLDRLIASRA